MRNPLSRLSRLGREEKRYWVPTLIGVGATISFLGVSLIYALGLTASVGWIDIGFGLGMVWWGARWYSQSRSNGQQRVETNIYSSGEDRQTIDHNDVRHEVITETSVPYYLGEHVRFSMKMTNLLDEPCTRNFFYKIQLPDGMCVNRPLYPVNFAPHEEIVVPLGAPVFLGFLGIFRLVIVTGQAEKELIDSGQSSAPITFQTLFAGYSRDREGHESQIQMVKLTDRVGRLTIALIVLTVTLVIFQIRTWLLSG